MELTKRPDAVDFNDDVDGGGDLFLRVIASTVEDAALTLGVTLCVNGLVVTGTLVSRKQYLNDLVSGLEQGQGLAPQFGEVLGTNASKLVSPLKPRELVSNLCLVDVTLYGGGRPIGHPGPWRVAVEHVSAWTLGAIRFGEDT